MAAYGHRVQIALKCRSAHAVNNQICAPPLRDPLGFSGKILLCVDDNVVSAGRARRPCFRLSRDCADHVRTKVLGPLHQQASHPARSRVNQHEAAGNRQPEFMDQVVCRHALQRERRAFLERKFVGKRNQALASASMASE